MSTILPMAKKPTKAERIERLKAFGFELPPPPKTYNNDPVPKVYGVEIYGLEPMEVLKLKTLVDHLVGLSPHKMPLREARKLAVVRLAQAISGFLKDCNQSTRADG